MILHALLWLAGTALGGVEVREQAAPDMEDVWAPRRIALVVGLDSYADPELDDLVFASKDSVDMSRALQDPALGAFDQVVTLSGMADRQDILDAMGQVADELQKDDTFLLYFAGHGTMDLGPEGTRLVLLASDAILARATSTGLDLADLELFLERLPARRKVLVVDACWSGSGRSALSSTTRDWLGRLRGPAPEPTLARISRMDVQLFAAHHNQPAIEAPELQNGVYTHFLVEALSGAGDLDGDGLVDVFEAHTFAGERTMAFTGGVQVPWIRSTTVGRSAIYLAGDPERRQDVERAILAGFQHLPAGARVLLDGQVRGAGALEPGWHRLQVEVDGHTLYRGRSRFKAGDRLDLAQRVRERASSVSAQVGVEAVDGEDALSRTAVQVEGAFWPVDLGNGRPFLGASASWGLGPIGDGWKVPNGDLQGRLGHVWGRRLQVGPAVGAGVLWRAPIGDLQGGMLVEPSLRLSASFGPWTLVAEPGVRVFRLDDQVRGQAGGGLALGWRGAPRAP